jgi:hypothetical protein
MSLNALEMALWQAYTNHDHTARLKVDPQAYAARFDLDEGERRMLVEGDFMAQIGHGANSLLVMMVWQALNGLEDFPKYFAAVNGLEPETMAPA